MDRPKHLPDFSNPPLDEVVFGIQFVPVPNLTSLSACKTRDLFIKNYPIIKEVAPLDSQFETFGGPNSQPGFHLKLGASPIQSRFWFISREEDHLLQYQSDMFLSNWRKNPTSQAPQPYPRFEKIYSDFEDNLNALEDHFSRDYSFPLDINQAEVTYINVIPVDNFSDASEWLDIWDSVGVDTESLQTSFREIIRDEEGHPLARLKHEIQSVVSADGSKKALRLSLTYKGKPKNNDINSALDFIKKGRETIVTRFDHITTNTAHQIWGKTK